MVALASPVAAAQGFIWADGYPSQDIYREEPVRRARPAQRSSVLPKSAAQAEKIAAAGHKPQGPLVIAVSIQRQNVRVYDANGLFAESPISSGMAGHPTPMGVFSIIQRSKYHRSNIYSGAPMPYMQRVTWSGIAMHAGVLPGYPASHGCIRMPMSFAMKMWGWTRMGARVVITPGEVSPATFAHPALDALVPPAPVAAAMPHIKTADASATLTGASHVMTDAATHVATDDLANAAAAAEPQASERIADPAAGEDGLPPVPGPVALDLSDIETQVGPVQPETAAASEPAVAATAAAAAATEPAPVSPKPAEEPTALPPSVAAETAAPLIKRGLPVAIFISRKDGKIYVRQNFAPVLEMPIEIAASDRPLGTHVFTARKVADEDRTLAWSVVTLPASPRQAQAASNARGRRNAAAAPVAVQIAANSPDEALSRLTIPSELMARLGETLPSGSSLVVSDQGIAQGETGEGTDFIVRLR